MIANHAPLTEHQAKVLRYLEGQRDATGLMPSTREVQAHFRFASQSQAMSVLRALEKKGAIERLPKKARGLVLSGRHGARGARVASIPVLGTIPAGQPVDATENVLGYLEVDPRLFGSPPEATTFALQVRGDSMIGASIHDGDYAILQSTESRSPHPNDIVAALIDDEATLKRYLVLEGAPCLKAENPAYPDLIPVRELLLQGVYLGLLRGVRNLIAA